MVGPLLLLKMLHCRKIRESSASSSHREERNQTDRQTVKKLKKKYGRNYYPENTCRVCLKETDIMDRPIFGDSEIEEDISQALSTIGGIEIDKKDTYPKYICHSCHGLLQVAIVLRKTAQKSDKLLKESSRHVNEATLLSNINYDDNIFMSEDNDNIDNTKLVWEPPKSYVCDKCDLEFTTVKEFCDHNVSVNHEEKRVTCPVCNKTYSSVYYKTHKNIHQPKNQFMCDICGKIFSTNGTLTRHRLTHFYKLPFQCPHCPYRGRFRVNLQLHLRTHTGEKPYQCSECAARFNYKSNLNKHILTHREDRDLNCDTCGKCFVSKKRLEIHIKVEHLGIRDEICDVCSKAFGTRKQMMKHKLRVHKRPKLKSGRMPLYLQVEKMGLNIEN